MISLREYSDADVERLVKLANNRNVSRYLIDSFPFPYTPADARWWIATGSAQHGTITRVIELDGVFVGSIGYAPQAGWRAHQVEIGYWVGEAYWGRGIASAALGIMTAQILGSAAYSKICAPVLAPNTASMRVLEKNGYVREGVLRHEVIRDGVCHDVHLYAQYGRS